jgi:MFS family permease
MNEINNRSYGWLVVTTMFFATAVTSIIMIAPAPFIQEIARTMSNLSVGKAANITMTVFNISLAVAGILGGPLLDKFGVIKVYITGLSLISIGTLLTPFIGSSTEGIVIIRILQALGAGPVLVSSFPVAALYLPPKYRGLLFAAQGLAVSAGVKIGISLVPKISEATGGNWQTAIAWLTPFSILCLLLSIITALCLKQNREERRTKETNALTELKFFLSSAAIWVVFGCIGIAACVNSLFNVSFSNTIHGNGNFLPATMIYLELVIFILAIIGSFVGVLIAELLCKGNERPAAFSGFLLAAISIFLVGLPFTALNQNLYIIFSCTAFFTLSFILPLTSGFITKYYPKNITGTLGGLTCIPSMVAIASTTYIMTTPPNIYMLGAISVIGVIIAIFLKPVKQVYSNNPGSQISLSAGG